MLAAVDVAHLAQGGAEPSQQLPTLADGKAEQEVRRRRRTSQLQHDLGGRLGRLGRGRRPQGVGERLRCRAGEQSLRRVVGEVPDPRLDVIGPEVTPTRR